MSVFVRKDPRLLASADPSWPAALYRMLRRHALVACALLALGVLAYAANLVAGLHVAAQVSGTIRGLQLYGGAAIARDARGIPHIRASNAHDLFFAQGFAEASDRLFEMDLTRRYAYGRLAEVFGAKALPLDENMRAADVREIAQREWRGTDAQTRSVLQAFSAGVNAAMHRQRLPVEFRMLLYQPQPWTPQDSIAVSLVAALELGDSWYDVLDRDYRARMLGARCFRVAYPLSDPRYDVTIDGRIPHAAGRDANAAACDGSVVAYREHRSKLGSNAWAAGALRTAGRRALIANDPHVDLTIPGIWYVVDLHAPGLHVAGAVIPGLPGVVLGHNERVAWAVTNAQVATNAVYRMPSSPQRLAVSERFGVRFAQPVTKIYYRTRDAFSINVDDDQNVFFVRWPQYRQRSSTIPTLLALNRATSIASAMRALSAYRGAPQNFIVADSSGSVAYHLAGAIYDDPAWGRYVHPAREMRKPLHVIPFGELPSRAASRGGVLLSANNRMYGRGYPYRLSAAFEPPYRAYRIATLLHARTTYDAAYFERMQMDSCSPVDAEIAREVARLASSTALAHWNGCFTGSSRAASLEHQVRDDLAAQNSTLALLLAKLRHPRYDVRDSIDESAHAALAPVQDPAPWSHAGRVSVDHPLSAAWYGLLSGAALPGNGDEYTIHLQEPGFAQGFRAVWDVGNWDAGGIVLPSGESGEPGSGHYDDLMRTWVKGSLVALPFSQRAVARATIETLSMTP